MLTVTVATLATNMPYFLLFVECATVLIKENRFVKEAKQNREKCFGYQNGFAVP